MIRIRRNPLPSPKKIMKRGLYEIMWGAPQRDYGKYVGLDNKKKKKQNFIEKRWLYKSCRYLKERNEIFSSFLFFLELLRRLVLMILRF